MSYQAIVYDVRNHIGYVTLNRPQSMNAINLQMRLELIDFFTSVEDDPVVRVVVISGAGERAFSYSREDHPLFYAQE